jgi:hypothetical protein
MTTIYMSNGANLPANQFKTLVDGVKYFAPLVTRAWNLPAVTVVTTPTAGSWIVNITEANRQLGATGYHEDVNGLPVAYCSPKACVELFGTFFPQIISQGRMLKPNTYNTGLITTICHEIAEMLCDPFVKTYSAVDSKNRKWLVEVCDHVFGVYWAQSIDGVECVFPDVTTPAFYSLTGKAPFDLQNVVKAPFTLTPNGYGYYETSTGLAPLTAALDVE